MERIQSDDEGKKFLPFLLLFLALILFLFLVMQPLIILEFRDKIAVLFPKGIIALEERNLLFHNASHYAAGHHPGVHPNFCLLLEI